MKRIAIVLAAVLYVISPIDLIPDFLFPFGFGDDAIVVLMAIRALTKEETS